MALAAFAVTGLAAGTSNALASGATESSVLASAPRSTGSDDGFEVERARAAAELLTGLSEYAEWCASKQIWLERNRALEAILVFDPTNLAAKRGLGYVQVADGVWEPPKGGKPARNYDPAALKEAPQRYAKAVGPWRERLLALLESRGAELTPFQRESVYAELIAVDPDDAFARAARGEVKLESGWVLAQTATAKANRARLRALVKSALQEAPVPTDVAADGADAAYGLTWKSAVATPRVRVLSTGERDEAARVARTVHATREVFESWFGARPDLGPSLTIYLVCDAGSKQKFLEHAPGLTADKRAFIGSLEGSGIGALNDAVWWAPTPERRLDGVVRHVIGASLTVEFGVTVDVAWAWEGLGLYLTRELVGTRLTWYVRPPEVGGSVTARPVRVDWIKKLQTPGTNWMNEGYRLLRARDPGGLGAALTRAMNQISPEELFLSYVACAYLLESESERLPTLLRALGGSHREKLPGPAAVENVLGLDLADFHARLVRWLRERR